MVKISVIIPVYNVEDYLKDCLDSIISQSFDDIEIICVDDGSEDLSLDILKSYQKQDSRIKIITQENKGPGAARNRGLDISNGEYIYFMDSDDYLEDGALAEMIQISEDKNLDLLMFKLINFNNETGEKDYNYSNMPFLDNIEKETFTYNDFKDNIFKVDVTVYTKLFKRELISDKRFDEHLIHQDNLFYMDYIFDAERIYFLNKCLYHRRIRPNSIITSSGKKQCDVITVFNKLGQKLKDRKLYDDVKEDFFIYTINGLYYRYSLSKVYKKEFYAKIREDIISKQEEYMNEIDFDKIDAYSKTLFDNFLRFEDYNEFDKAMKDYRRKKKVKKTEKEKNNLFTKIKKWSPFNG